MSPRPIYLHRRLLVGGLMTIPLSFIRPLAALAQEMAATPNAISTPQSGSIVAIGQGELPSTGSQRPGPIGRPAAMTVPRGVNPVGVIIPAAAVDADIERLKVVDGKMADPTGPWVVAWYDNLSALGEQGNVVLAGHVDYWNVGPSVFYNVGDLQPGDEIDITGEDGQAYDYAVQWVETFDAANAPLNELTGPTGEDSLTLITCGGTFDYASGEYLQRTVVRAVRVGTTG